MGSRSAGHGDPNYRFGVQKEGCARAASTSTSAGSPHCISDGKPGHRSAGGTSTLSWTTQNATDVTLQGNRVGPSGSQTVDPSASTTYRLTAKGDGGTQEATARVTVTPAAPPVVSAPQTSEQQLFAQSMKDVYFDYDSYQVRASEQAALQADANFLKAHPAISFTMKATATSVARPSTTWRSATTAPTPSSRRW